MIPRQRGQAVAWTLLAGWLLATPTFAADPLPRPVSLRGTLSSDGASASIRITVANPGERTSAPGTLEVYLSADGLVDPGDARIARRALTPLASGARIDIDLTPPVPPQSPGRYYLVARVVLLDDQAVSPASDALWGAPLAIGPDLTIDELRTTLGRHGVVLSGRVANRGTQAALPGSLGAFWTARDGASVGRAPESAPFSGLPPGGVASFEWTATTGDLPPGEYGIDVEVDPDHLIAESDDANNRSQGDVSFATGPDLAIAELSARQDGDTIVVHDAVVNHGNAPSGSCGVLFVLSRNGIWDAGDVSIGYRIVPALDPDATSAAQTRFELPKERLPTGRYFLLGKVDASDHVAEGREANNLTLAAAPVDVRVQP
jgi:hypothetical protein